jgi:hypothetical protein
VVVAILAIALIVSVLATSRIRITEVGINQDLPVFVKPETR